jgi:hypothetical protein
MEMLAKYTHVSKENYTAGEDGQYKFSLILGNNANIVRKVLETRENWTEQTDKNTLFSFKWAPTMRFCNFD